MTRADDARVAKIMGARLSEGFYHPENMSMSLPDKTGVRLEKRGYEYVEVEIKGKRKWRGIPGGSIWEDEFTPCTTPTYESDGTVKDWVDSQDKEFVQRFYQQFTTTLEERYEKATGQSEITGYLAPHERRGDYAQALLAVSED